MSAARSLVGVLLWCLASSLSVGIGGAEPPGTDTPPEEPKRLNEIIEKAVDWYDVLPANDAAAPLPPRPVLRWRNVVRGQDGEAMMVIWPHNGRPEAMASIYPWKGRMCHEFGSLSRGNQLTARDKGTVIWSPETAGVEFRDVPAAPKPAKTPAERSRQMRAIAERFTATMTGWQADNTDREVLRLLPRPLYRYELASARDPDPNLLDGVLFAFVQGTDPEVVLVLEAIGTAEKADWRYALARSTSGGLEVKLGGEVVWTAEKHPANRLATRPHFTMQRVLEK